MGKFVGLSARIILSLILSGSQVVSFAQTYSFRNYNIDQGLPGKFVYTINQDPLGFIWLGTSKGIARFDGFSFYPVALSDTLSTAFPFTSITSSSGIIYYGYSDGRMFYVDDNSLKEITGAETFRINSIIEDNDGSIIYVSQSKGLFRVIRGEEGTLQKISSPSDDLLYCASITPEGDIILGTQQGVVLSRFRDNVLEKLYESPELRFNRVQAIAWQERYNRFILGTEDDGIYSGTLSGDSIIIGRITENEIINRSRVQSLYFDSGGNLWISTFGDGVFKILFSNDGNEISNIENFNADNGLAGNDVKTLFQDMEGNLFMGMFGDGLSILGSDAYSFYKPGNGNYDNSVIYLDETDEGLFVGTQSGYYLFDLNTRRVKGYTDLTSQIGPVRINLFHKYYDGSFLVGTDGKGVFHLDKRGKIARFYNSSNNSQNTINDINHEGDLVWIATNGGVILSNTKSLEYSVFTTYERLPHNKVNQIIIAGRGKVYIATEGNRLYTIDAVDGVQAGKAVIYGGTRNRFQSVAIDSQGKIWGATEGAGLYCFAGDTVWGINQAQGLYSNFCYSLLCDSKDNIWVGHEQGFSVYDQEMKQVRSFDEMFGGGADCNRNSIFETSGGLVTIGTTEGMLIYDRTKDQSRFVPPLTNILSVTINNVEYPYMPVYNLPYRSRYDIRVNYVGLYFSDPQKVWYKTRLDNYDEDWSDATFSRSAIYKLSDGEYHFSLLSFNFDGITDGITAGFDLNIRNPVWRTWWFLLSLFVFASGIVVLIVRIRDRAQRKVKMFLEEELAERTREVIIQKEEIELQNREITDSINYAQRIQASLLPPVSKLRDAFKGSFVFYRPRDIVSGDFYWFERIDEDRFIIVCADSTGHGVPGAFMSMIGSALIQEIVTRKEITRPSEVLSTLDREISKTLNQHVDDKSTSDGMDMVVCEFNQKTKMLRFASAMRPVIIVMGGEQYYIRGNKNSVGGESVTDKYFDDQEYFLKEDDSFYMFSDGLPDQFGGESGKKMKIARLKSLIDELKDVPMDEQYKIVSDFFDLWKGDLDQVDDVLLMGIRV